MTETGKVLIIDDDTDLRFVLSDIFRREGFSVKEASDGVAGLNAIESEDHDAVLLDLNMPGMNGADTLTAIKKMNPGLPVVILSGYGDIPTAVEVIKLGAYDFATKPPDFERLILLLRRAVEFKKLGQQVECANSALELSLESMLGRSSATKKCIDLINFAAATNLSVIIQGETGTGKSFVAETLHNLSKRAGRPFVRVDIGLIPDSLVESELFGHRKGAFTSAQSNKIGFFEAAHTGTIFIDEIENMSPVVQSKLLTVIERKEIYPLGSTAPVSVDIRIIAATNSNIRQSIANKQFREDLFYRLGEFTITIPPLRERTADIPFFAQKFLLEACAEMKKQIRGISDEGRSLLESYAWPGNLRELKNVIKRAVLFSGEDMIGRKNLESLIHEGDGSSGTVFSSLREEIRDLEKKRIAEALIKKSGNKSKAAEMLRISYKSFCEKIKEYKIK